MGKHVHYYFNYSAGEVKASYMYGGGTNLLDGKSVSKDESLILAGWDVAIIEEK